MRVDDVQAGGAAVGHHLFIQPREEERNEDQHLQGGPHEMPGMLKQGSEIQSWWTREFINVASRIRI
jgi:hypothetical protein